MARRCRSRIGQPRTAVADVELESEPHELVGSMPSSVAMSRHERADPRLRVRLLEGDAPNRMLSWIDSAALKRSGSKNSQMSSRSA